ncbi:MAG: nitrogen regulation protein NR(I) [Arenicellales bacterium]|jgi:two-component system nitrogen regulation response regulator GlnG|nr:nitrogen regulation protein NR(I) [Arenicellales bacterium]MDP7155163.1 nitrogen regulation protein NR(I) [Arenicellales bacterium]MDP7453294.1 nitrogen regulation protein NR(I) [Arenicellales bacterium]
MENAGIVWVVDDDTSIRWVLERALQQAGLAVELFESADAALEQNIESEPSVILTDIRMPGTSGLEFLEQLNRRAPQVPVIIMTAHSDLESAVSSYQGGAFEYLPKPFDIDEAVNLVKRAMEQQATDLEHEAASRPNGSHRLIGAAPAMQDVFRAIGRLSGSGMTVLISGESGTGKELVAHALYETGANREGPFVAINTAAIPSELLESELFGHEKGAFTGAATQRIGRFEQADGGTLFLDEIGEMPGPLQTRLLRVLAEGKFYRVGGHQEVKVNVRVIAATNRKLEERVEAGKFREDLFHRLNVIRIKLPPLRDRGEDIPALAASFLRQCAEELETEVKTLTPEALAQLKRHGWSGNVRELENTCRWLTVMAPGPSVTLQDLPDEVKPQADESSSSNWELLLKRTVEQKLALGKKDILSILEPRFERVLIKAALNHTGGHKQEAAKRLGWGRNTLTRKLKELDLES